MIEQKAVYIDAGTGDFRIETVNDERILGPIDFGYFETQKDKDSFCFGSGILAGSMIPGAKRLMFFTYSPLWENFYVSSIGGGSQVFHKTGLNYVCIRNACKTLKVMKLNRKEGQVAVSFDDVDVDMVWQGYDGMIGAYALQKYCFDKYKGEFAECRILASGPAAMWTNTGAILSAPVMGGKLTAVDGWAGRGGFGSKLVQHHRIAAIIYGGDFVDTDVKTHDSKEINKLFMDKYHKLMIPEDLEVTRKYSYDPNLHTGGTFGVNYLKIGTWMFCFNYNSIYFTNERRKWIHEKFILEHYHKQFDEETIGKKQFKNCGEACPVVCKKMNNEFKKDYEPYESLGPNCGIFDQRAAEKLNHHADAMGFDGIQIGSVVSWIMDIIDKRMIRKEEFGITAVPKWDPDNFDLVQDSMHNANLGIDIINMILFNEKGAVFRNGIRKAAKELDERFKTETINQAVFLSHGKDGCMVPNQYWVPGMFGPMVIMGKYFAYYGAEFYPPKELGKKNVERMIKEISTDNIGMCRFHRVWSEEIMETVVNDLFKTNYDFFEHHKKLAQLLNLDNKPVFWESEKVMDIIKIYLEKILSGEPENAVVKEWVEKFGKDKYAAAREYWNLMIDGMNEAMR